MSDDQLVDPTIYPALRTVGGLGQVQFRVCDEGEQLVVDDELVDLPVGAPDTTVGENWNSIYPSLMLLFEKLEGLRLGVENV